MRIRQLLVLALAAGVAAIPRAPANAQYACSFPLEWPFCVAGAAVATAGAIATAPFRPYYYYPYYYGPPYYPAYYYYPHRRHYYRRHYYKY